MMNFRRLQKSIVELLGSESAGRFRVVGYQPQGDSAPHVIDDSRSVQVFYSQGDFPKAGAAIGSTPTRHKMTFRLEFTCSKAAEGDLSTLEDPGASAGALAAALAAFQNASDLAGDSLDELFDFVYQVLMDTRNLDLGMPRPIANRWVDDFNKDVPMARGELAILTGSAQLTCAVEEELEGVAALNVVTPGGPLLPTEVDTVVRIEDDENEGKAGVRRDNPAPA